MNSLNLPDQAAVHQLFSLQDKVALVTGGAAGLGRTIAWGFACQGSDVVIVDRDAKAGQKTAQEIGQTGRRVLALAAEASDEDQVERAVGNALAQFGKIDILVNGAGHNVRKPMLEMSVTEFDSLHAVHVRGAFLFARRIGLQMQERKAGSIINIASILGHVGALNVTAYAAAKGALVQLTKALALEMAPSGVRVNSIAPGYIDTALTRQHADDVRNRIIANTPLGRFGATQELIGAAVFLASDAASFVTGTSVVVDGGWTAQ